MSTIVILPFHGLVIEHKEILRVDPFGGLDVPTSLKDMRSKLKAWKDSNLSDWLKDGWTVKILKANSDVIQQMYGLPISPVVSEMLDRTRDSTLTTMTVLNNYTTAGSTTHSFVDGYRFAQIAGVGGGGGAGKGSLSPTAGRGGGGAAAGIKALKLKQRNNGALSITIGAAGTGSSTESTNGTSGGDTIITGVILKGITLTAGGGVGGSYGNGAGGVGGTLSSGWTTGTNGAAGGTVSAGIEGSGGGGAGSPTGGNVTGTGGSSGAAGTDGSDTGGGGGAAGIENQRGAAGGGGVGKPGGNSYNNATTILRGGSAGTGSGLIPYSTGGSYPTNGAGAAGGDGGGGGGGGNTGLNSGSGGKGSLVAQQTI